MAGLGNWFCCSVLCLSVASFASSDEINGALSDSSEA